MDFYLSLANCKKLKEWGCDLGISIKSCYSAECDYNFQYKYAEKNDYQTYHILEDICVKYAKEFFYPNWTVFCRNCKKNVTKNFNKFREDERVWEDNLFKCECGATELDEMDDGADTIAFFDDISINVLNLLKKGKKEEAEELIMAETRFNPSNR